MKVIKAITQTPFSDCDRLLLNADGVYHIIRKDPVYYRRQAHRQVRGDQVKLNDRVKVGEGQQIVWHKVVRWMGGSK